MQISNKLKNPIISGTLLLTASGILGKIIGFFYRIFLSRTIGAEGLGIYQLIFPISTICFAITVSGLSTALSKYIAEYQERDPSSPKRFLRLCLLLSGFLSLIIMLLLFRIYCRKHFIGTALCTSDSHSGLLDSSGLCPLLHTRLLLRQKKGSHSCRIFFYGTICPGSFCIFHLSDSIGTGKIHRCLYRCMGTGIRRSRSFSSVCNGAAFFQRETTKIHRISGIFSSGKTSDLFDSFEHEPSGFDFVCQF